MTTKIQSGAADIQTGATTLVLNSGNGLAALTAGKTFKIDLYMKSSVTVSSIAGNNSGAGNFSILNAYTVDTGSGSFAAQSFIWKASTGADTTLTITYSGSNDFRVAFWSEWSGLDTTTQPDASAPAANTVTPVGSGTDVIVSSSTTPVTNGALILGSTASILFSASTSVDQGTGFTLQNHDSAANGNGASIYLIQTTAAAVTAKFSVTGYAGNRFLTMVSALRPASGGGGTVKTRKSASGLGTRAGTRQPYFMAPEPGRRIFLPSRQLVLSSHQVQA